MNNLIIIIIVGVILLITSIFGVMFFRNLDSKTHFIHIKSGKHYKILFKGKMKLPVERTWLKAVVYYNLEDGYVYVRDYFDFNNKFISIKEYKQKQKNDRKERRKYKEL